MELTPTPSAPAVVIRETSSSFSRLTAYFYYLSFRPLPSLPESSGK